MKRFFFAIPVLFLAPHLAGQESVNLRRTATVEVVRKTKDAVVNISATKLVSRRLPGPFWFDMGDIVRVPANSLGSGFLIHPSGYVVTNHHVIDRARQIHVELADGRKLPAELISSDADADLAILKISDPRPFPTVELGDSSDLLIGEPVIAVGNPLGFSHSVSTGIISALHRDLKDPDGQVILADLIQTDAAINPGNSGGPLLNAYAQVIGINTAIRGDAQNIGFAIPVNRFRELVPELMSPLQAAKLDIPLKLFEKRSLAEPATVSAQVFAQGIKQPIVALNGQKISNIVDAYAILLAVNQKQVLVTLADGSLLKVEVRPAPMAPAVVEARRRLGITVEQITPMLAEREGLPVEQGLRVTQVIRGSVADRAGLRPGDILLQLGRYRIQTLADFDRLLHALPATGRVRIAIIRGEQMAVGTLDLQPE